MQMMEGASNGAIFCANQYDRSAKRREKCDRTYVWMNLPLNSFGKLSPGNLFKDRHYMSTCILLGVRLCRRVCATRQKKRTY